MKVSATWLFAPLATKYSDLSCTITERRRTWIYEVPLPYTHRLRSILNMSAAPLPVDEMRRFDLPVIASCVKVSSALRTFSRAPCADMSARSCIFWNWRFPSSLQLCITTSKLSTLVVSASAVILPHHISDSGRSPFLVGADTVEHGARIQGLLSLLERVPKVHLVVLDALLSHLKDLISATEEATNPVDGEADGKPVESDLEYIAKLAASLGPCILRPAVENSKTLNDRFPAQLFADLLKEYTSLLPPTLEKKAKVEEERYAPKRQRTKMVDQRVTRSTTALKDNKKHSDWLKEELEKKMGTTKIMEEPEDMPSLPEKSSISEQIVVKEEMPTPPVKEEEQRSDKEAEVVVNEKAEEQQEESQIPPVPEIVRPTSSSGESERDVGGKTPGFVTPSEEMAEASVNPTSQLSPSSEPSENLEPPQSAASEVSAATTSDLLDEDKPLAPSSSLMRSSTGSSARRNPLSRSGATRGPRPMSVHAPPSSAGGSTGSASSAAGVRARAAMFEQKSSPSPK